MKKFILIICFFALSALGWSQILDEYFNVPEGIRISTLLSNSEDLDGYWRFMLGEDESGNAVMISFRKVDDYWAYFTHIAWSSIESEVDITPFLVAQFGCPHSDADMNALNNPKFNWKPRKPFERGVKATITAGKTCDVYHVLGDWSGQQVVNEKDEKILAAAISDDITSGRLIFEKNVDQSFEMKSIAGNHISKYYAQDKNDVKKEPINRKSYLIYEKAVQETIDNFPVKTQLKVYRDTSSKFDYKWESYYYIKGNNLFFFLSDRNDVDAPWGKKNSVDEAGKPLGGGHPAGAIRKSSLDFFVDVAIKHADKNIFLHTHQGLPNTVVGTSTKINGWKGHNDRPLATKKWKGTIGALVNPELIYKGQMQIEKNDSIFNLLFNQWDQFVVGCANSHTHAPVNYKSDPFFTGDENEDVKTVNNDHYSWLNKTFIMNVGNLTRHHGHYVVRKNIMHPHGSIWEFTPTLDSMTTHKLIVEDVRIFKTNYRAQAGDLYKPDEKKYQLKYPYDPSFEGEDPTKPNPISDVNLEQQRDSVIVSFRGFAEAFAIVSSNSPIDFTPESFNPEKEEFTGRTYIPSYKVSEKACPDCIVLRYQGTSTAVKLPNIFNQKFWNNRGEEKTAQLTHNYFKIFALNGANGKVIYSDGVEVELK